MDNSGAPGESTGATTLQKTPVKAKLLPVILPVSGWPVVTLTT